MPTWVKVILIILLIGVVLIGVATFLAWRWVQNNAPGLEQAGEAAIQRGKTFGRGKPPEACVAETLNRVQKCDSMICEVTTKLFLSNCLEAAQVTPQFCASVPQGIVAGATWAVDECARRGRANDQRCIRTLSAIPEFCRR